MSDEPSKPTGRVLPFPGGPVSPAMVDDDAALAEALEALLFAAGEPVTTRELADALGEVDPDRIEAALRDRAERADGGLRVVSVAGGWQLRTDPRFAEPIRRLRGGRPQVMSKAALEALSIVAYRQPVTRSDVDGLRGVNSGGVLKLLIDKGYVKVVGRRDEPGRPLEYGTTPLFLELFELTGLDALPTLAERESLADDEDGEEDDGLEPG